ncbi:N-acetylmuramoyl-L-alanine amidase [Dyella sp.]|uniref:N-acetylmuramoyl-L-alanine amidase n=1 Tax=Dyella sp. TaxID=1869338 RepID=UPI002ED26349
MNTLFSRVLSMAALLLLAGCASTPPHNPLARWVPSPNHDVRRPVLIVLHATEQTSARASLDTLRTRNSGGRVSAHYLIGSDGTIYQLVADEERAWHAGAGRWGSITDVNSASLGIELDNDAHSPYPTAQIDSLLRLLDDLTTRWRIPRTQVIGHEDLAPDRKSDPGALFPWQRLADAGYGSWPRIALVDPPSGFDPWLALAAIGYPLDHRDAALLAFHRHFRGTEGEETFDAQDLRILYALTRQASATP